MNAVATTTSTQPGPVPTSLPAPGASAQAPAGFNNFINVMLDAPSTPQVSDAQLADAMIRSMFASAGNVASVNLGRKAPAPPRAAQDSNAVPAQTAPVVPAALMAMTQSPLMRSVDTARSGAKGIAQGLPFGATVIPAAAKPATPAPLAFGMRITPVAQPETPAPAVQQEIPAAGAQGEMPAAAPQAAPLMAPAPEAPAVNVLPEAQLEPKATDDKPAGTAAAGIDAKIKQTAQAHDEPAPIIVAAAGTATNDGSNDFARQMPTTSSASPAQAGGKVESPAAPSASESLRNSEPAAPVSLAAPSSPVREISVRIATGQAPAVDVHLMERGGELHVAVRTADGGLQTSLRQDVGSLVNNLERSGYRAEAFTPREGAPAAAESAQTNSQNGRQGSESGNSGRGNYGDGSQNSSGGQQQRNSQQQGRDPRSQKWIEELENLK